MLDLVEKLHDLEELRTELQAKISVHQELVAGYSDEVRDINTEIKSLVAQIKQESNGEFDWSPHSATAVPLSRAERAVYELMELGLTHKEIGQRLNIAERTAKFHAINIYEKAGLPQGERRGLQARLLLFRRVSGQ